MYLQESADIREEVEKYREEPVSDEELEGDPDKEIDVQEQRRRAKATAYQK